MLEEELRIAQHMAVFKDYYYMIYECGIKAAKLF